ncbi:MAG: helix-turn-helix transcriptional regulator [Bacteroidales bacterium]|nr:helix-turn-helix transcriptional regulator [Candidatus Liminaster caballi]
MEFKDIVKQLRTERGWSQQDVADRLGVNKQTISQYERGIRKPLFDTAEQLADIFHVDLNYLMGFTDKIQKPAGDDTDPATNKFLGVTLEEIDLIEAWRHADEQTKRIVAYALKLGGVK